MGAARGRLLSCGVCLALLAAACTTPDAGPTTTGTLTGTSTVIGSINPAPTEPETSTPVPITQEGMLLGPGVDDLHITLGLLTGPAADRGFSVGLQLWRQTTNAAGGVCGRSISIESGGTVAADPTRSSARADDPAQIYRTLGTDVLGFVTMISSAAQATEIGELLSTDRIPALAVEGTSTDLARLSPVVIGPTMGILAINALDALVRQRTVSAGDRIGVVSDGSARAADALTGLSWYAARNDLVLDVQDAAGRDSATLAQLRVVFSLASAAVTTELADVLPVTTRLVTTVDGYDPTRLSPITASHVNVAVSTPATGSDNAEAAALTATAAASGAAVGARSLEGYAAGAAWERLLTAACDANSLSRDGVFAALRTVGAASDRSVLGPSDPALPAVDRLPATRWSTLAAADLTVAGALRDVSGLISADGIDGYAP